MNSYRRSPSPAFGLAPGSPRSETQLRASLSASEQCGVRYEQIRQVLRGYLSPILVDSVLERAMRARQLTKATLSDAALAELTSDIMVGLRLFVLEERLSQLMLELAEILDSEQP